MISHDWQRALDLFDEAAALATSERAAFLAAIDDPVIRRHVERLIEADSTPDPVFDAPFDEVAAIVTGPGPPLPEIMDLAGQTIGPYRLVKRIGRGGMGEVYLAERADQEFDRRVAIKLIRRGMDSEEVLRRFRAERRILAGLEHPGIARMYDGGMSDDGRPYLVMEFVAGEPIDRFCTRRNLSTAERVDLFRHVCRAVQFAHQNLVVHRDLKPSNILVADDGTVKLLDFGIARLLADDDDAGPTVTGLRMLTPRYASPEQAAGRTVTTASDLYSLGVILYELLTGLNPRETAPADASVTDAEPPSAAVLRTGSAFGVESPDFERPLPSRDTAAGTHRLARELRGDLDTIVLRAMKHDPRERFDSASSLEDDLRRYRLGLPIESRPDSAAYRIRKFVRRHRTGVAAAAIVVIAIAGSAVFSLGQAQRARQERDTAQEVASLLEDLFWSPNPVGMNTDRPDTLRIRDLMATAATRVRDELSDQSAVQARLLGVLGNVHRNLGLYDEATRLHRDGLDAAIVAWGERDPNVAAMYSALGHTLTEAGQLEAADSAFTQALDLGIALNGEDALPVAETRELYSRLLLRQRRFEETIPLLEASIAVRRRHLGDGDPLVATSLSSLAAAYTQLGRTAEATPVLAQAIEITRRELGDDHPNLATMLHNLAFMYRDLGRFEDAELPARDAVRLLADRLGDDHPDVARARANLAQVLDELDRHREADSLFVSVIETYRQRLGPGHPAVPIALANYGAVRRRRGDLDSAAVLVSHAVDIQRAITGDEHPSTAIVTNALAGVYIEQERFAEALPLLEQSLPIFERTFDALHPRIIDAQTSIGRALTGLGRLDEAERVLHDAYERAATRGDDDPRTQGVLRATAELFDKAGRTAEADSVRSKLPAGR